MELEQVNGKANAGLTLGIIGTALSAIEGAGGVMGILGGNRPSIPPLPPEDRPVTRYEMGLMNENRDLRDRLTLLEANNHTDNVAFGLQRQIDGQGAVNATVATTLNNQYSMIQQLMGMTRLTIPNRNLNPGYGPAFVAPMMPPFFSDPQRQQTDTNSGTEATNGG